MRINFFCPRWGSSSIPWDNFCLMVKEAGFDGVETPIPFEPNQKTEIKAALEKHKLLLIGHYYQSFEKDIAQHKKSFKSHLENIASLNPILIDSQTGKDYYTAGQNRELFELAAIVSKATGVVIAYETHRNKALFAAHIAHKLLLGNPDMVIAADFSHWCNLSESLLEQQTDAVNMAISRSVHINARVGHVESAQVSDPRAPEWQIEVDAHLNWWDQIIAYRLKQGAPLLTSTPEFGPVPYMPAIPFTQTPVANQWDINIYIKNLLKDKYKIRI